LLQKYNDPFFDDFFKDFDWMIPAGKEVRRYPLTNLYYDKKNEKVIVEVAMAGFSKDDIEIEIDGDMLVISGTKEVVEKSEDIETIQEHISSASFERKIKLHKDFLDGDIEAEYKDGLLKVVVSRKEKPKKLIEIK